MSNPGYFDAYKNLALSRNDNGVLILRFHTEWLLWTGETIDGGASVG